MRPWKFFRRTLRWVPPGTTPGIRIFKRPDRKKYHFNFKTYRPGRTLGRVTQVTPEDGAYIHSFFDICPFSPSQRYLAVTRLPFQHTEPVYGDTADVCVIDLEEQTIETVYTTKGWGFQTGANLNWGTTDRYLYAIEAVRGRSVCVRIDIENKDYTIVPGPMYHLAPDESYIVGFPLDLINATQRGYGIPEDPENRRSLPKGAAGDEGLWKTDLVSFRKTLLVSLKDAAGEIPDIGRYRGGTFYFFHTKINRQNTRVMQVVRYLSPWRRGLRRKNPHLITFKTDGSDIKLAVGRELWQRGGHHPNWHPDGNHLIQNLRPEGKALRFCQFKYDGSDLEILSSKHPGGGHPSISPDGRYLITDAYPTEPVVLENNEIPIRLLDISSDEEAMICSVHALGPGLKVLRLDPHPAWDRNYRKVCFNGAPEGVRQVFIADLSGIV